MALVNVRDYAGTVTYKDPIRSELPHDFRVSGDREFYSLIDNNVGVASTAFGLCLKVVAGPYYCRLLKE